MCWMTQILLSISVHKCPVTLLVLPVKTAFDKMISQYENQRTLCTVLILWLISEHKNSRIYQQNARLNKSPQTSAPAEVKIWFIIQPYVNVSLSSRNRTGPKTGWKICRAEPSSATLTSLRQLVENISLPLHTHTHTHGEPSICVRPVTDIMHSLSPKVNLNLILILKPTALGSLKRPKILTTVSNKSMSTELHKDTYTLTVKSF